MKRQSIFYILAFTCWLAACNRNPETGLPTQPVNPIEPISGVDTTKPLISPADDARLRNLILVPYTEDSLWGFADTSGHIVVAPQYKKVLPFRKSNLTLVWDTLQHAGIIDKEGRVVVPIKHRGISICGNDVFGFDDRDHLVLINQKGRRIDDGQIRSALGNGAEGLIAVQTQNGVGFMDTDGKWITPDKYKHIWHFAHGVTGVTEDGDVWYVINKKGERVSDLSFNVIFPFDNGYGIGSLAGEDHETRWGVIDTLGNVVIPFKYGHIFGSFEDDYLACPTKSFSDATETEQYHFEILNRQGKKISESTLNFSDYFSQGLIVVEKGEKFGYADSSGKLVIPCTYDMANPFEMGMAWVKVKDRYGFIDKTGKPVIPIQYGSLGFDYVGMVPDGISVADYKTGERFYIDPRGREYRNFPH